MHEFSQLCAVSENLLPFIFTIVLEVISKLKGKVTSGYSFIYIYLIVGAVEYILCIDLQSIAPLQVVATMLGSKYFICKT